MVRPPVSREDRRPDKVFAAAGGTGQDLVETSRTAQVVPKPQSASTQANHNGALRHFVQFAKSVNDLSIFPGHPTNPEAVVRRSAGDLDHTILHPFMKWKAMSTIGKLEEGMSMVSAASFLEHFVNAYRRVTGSKISKATLISTKAYLEQNKEAFGLHNGKRDKLTPDAASIMDFLEATLSPDWRPCHIRTRFDMILYVNIAIASATRAGAVLVPDAALGTPEEKERGLRYGQCRYYIQRNPSSNPDEDENVFLMRFTLRSTKTEEGNGRSYNLTPHSPAFVNGSAWAFMLALQDKVFVGDPSFAWLLHPSALGDSDIREVHVKEDCKNILLFRSTMSHVRSGDDTDFAAAKPMSVTKIGALLREISKVAGFDAAITAHSFRRMMVTSLKESGVAMHDIQFHLGHKMGSDVIKHYMSSAERKDVAYMLLNDTDTSGLIKAICANKVKADPDRPLALSTHYRDKIFADPDVSKLFADSLEMENRLVLQYGSPKQAPQAEYQAFKDLYRKGELAYNRHHSYWLKVQLEDYNKQKKSVIMQVEQAITVSDSAEAEDQAVEGSIPPAGNNLVDECPVEGDTCGFSLESFKEAVEGQDFSDLNVISAHLGEPGLLANEELQSMLDDVYREDAVNDGDIMNTYFALPDEEEVAEAARMMSSTVREEDIDPALLAPSTTLQTGSPPPFQPHSADFGDDFTISDRGSSDASTSAAMIVTESELTRSSSPVIHLVQRNRRAKKGRGASVSSVRSSLSRSSREPSEGTSSTFTSTPASSLVTASSPQSDTTLYGSEMDRLFELLSDQKASVRDVFKAVADLPSYVSAMGGYFPGLSPLGSQRLCPNCEKPVSSFVKNPRGRKENIIGSEARHVMKCCAAKANQDALPTLNAYFDQAQICPLCVANNDEDSDGEEVDKPKAICRTSEAWYRHVIIHIGRAVDGRLDCCEERPIASISCMIAHFALKHKICMRPGQTASQLTLKGMPTAPFSFRDFAFVGNFVEWEEQCTEEYNRIFNPTALPAAYSVRSDISMSGETPNFIHNIPDEVQTQPDLKYCGEASDNHKGAPLSYSVCIFCAHNPRLSYSDRLQQIHPEQFRTHLGIHWIDIWKAAQRTASKTANLAEPPTQPTAGPSSNVLMQLTHSDDSVEDDNEDASDNASIRDLTLADFGLRACPDPVCSNATNLNVLQFLNHLFFVHCIPLLAKKRGRTNQTFSKLSMQSLDKVKELCGQNPVAKQRSQQAQASNGKKTSRGKGKKRQLDAPESDDNDEDLDGFVVPDDDTDMEDGAIVGNDNDDYIPAEKKSDKRKTSQKRQPSKKAKMSA